MAPPDTRRLAGAATAAGTRALAERQPAAGFYRPGWDGLTVSTVGLGTYLGEPDAATDARYQAAVERYLELGGNLIDSAINYRFQRSERVIGRALAEAVAAGRARRDEVVVCTKAGYLSFDGGWPPDPDRWVRETFIEPGIIQPDELVDGHCLAPAYLRHELARSLANLGVERVDLYYLHNPEGQRAALGHTAFLDRLREAFATLEVAVAQGRIGAFGLATWNGLRAAPDAPEFLPLPEIIELARDVSGDRHHLRAVQLPVNFQMLDALARPNQPAAQGHGLRTLLQTAADLGLAVIASAPMLQARLLGRLPEALRARFAPGLTDAQRALQFVRSLPGVTAVLAGMSQAAHVDENLALRAAPPLTGPELQALFGRPAAGGEAR
jgi:aryl-alcohol dehydrogenase-like predicted oxidoreductase